MHIKIKKTQLVSLFVFQFLFVQNANREILIKLTKLLSRNGIIRACL